MLTKTTIANPACPACGGLQCLCRPRFFAGQLLTEDDLNRLERYVVEKNRLHNRHLVGWGVACGLEVLCHQCKGFVTVRSGYALSPCGDDIVVCEDTAVNVCDLIKRCTEYMEMDCDPAWPRPDPLCGDEDADWILYICYDEKPSRGITALRGGSGGACCSRCSGGGSSQCGCGCHAKTTNGGSKCATRSPTRSPAQQCEPTLTCEGYTFQLRRVPTERRVSNGPFVQFVACFNEARISLQKELINFAHQGKPQEFQSAVLEFLGRHTIHNCSIFEQLTELTRRLTPPGGVSDSEIKKFVFALFKECICTLLLPPCPEPAADNCVPLATLTINCKDGCRITNICNLENRRFLVTFPTLGYWLGDFLPLSGLSELLANFCCGQTRQQQLGVAFVQPTGADLFAGMFANAEGATTITPKSLLKQLGTILKKLLVKLASSNPTGGGG
jgi:hypothetical protein